MLANSDRADTTRSNCTPGNSSTANRLRDALQTVGAHAKLGVRRDMAYLGIVLPRLALSRNLRREEGPHSKSEGTHCGGGRGGGAERADDNRWHTLAFP